MVQTSVGRLSGSDSEVRRWVFLAVGIIILTFTATSRVVGAEASKVWRSDFKSALQEAEGKKLPLLIHFYADWCMPCKRMEREVFPTSAVSELLGSRFIAVKINSDHHQDLVTRYGVDSLPSDVIVDSLTGKTIAVYSGFQDRTVYLNKMTQAEARFIKAHAGDLVVAKSNSTTDMTENAIGTGADRVELGDPQPVIGLDGFSPVSLTKTRQWNRGSAKFAWDYKDVTYYMTNRDELVEFRSNPAAYAPKHLGCDPVILWETDKAVAGDIRYGAFFDGELFLFKSEERRRQFKSSPEKFIKLQHALKADQIERTVMR